MQTCSPFIESSKDRIRGSLSQCQTFGPTAAYHNRSAILSRTARRLIFHTASLRRNKEMEGRRESEGEKLRRFSSRRCPGNIFLCFVPSPNADWVCVNTLFFSFFYLYPLFSLYLWAFHRVIPHRWRSDTFDNSGPRGVDTEVIACCCPSLSAAICPQIRMPLHRLADKVVGVGWGGQGGNWHRGKVRLWDSRRRIDHAAFFFPLDIFIVFSEHWRKLPRVDPIAVFWSTTAG